MRNRLFFILGEAVALNLIVVLIIWKMNIEHFAILIILCNVSIAIVVAIQINYFVIRPFSEQLNEMKKITEESKRAEQIRREFVANVSHELKTPLTSISGFIETLQDGAAEDPEIRTRFIDIIAIETSRLKRLIEDLLVLSDIERRRESEDNLFSINSAVESTVESLRLIADDRNIRIIVEMEEQFTLIGSRDRFCQMMVNLIENAIKYSNENGTIWIRAYCEGDKTVVTVKDCGIGIAPEHHQRLFERFYRVDKSRSKKAGGTGLGLSIVKHIAALFEAELRVESQVGEGAEFLVYFNKIENEDDIRREE